MCRLKDGKYDGRSGGCIYLGWILVAVWVVLLSLLGMVLVVLLGAPLLVVLLLGHPHSGLVCQGICGMEHTLSSLLQTHYVSPHTPSPAPLQTSHPSLQAIIPPSSPTPSSIPPSSSPTPFIPPSPLLSNPLSPHRPPSPSSLHHPHSPCSTCFIWPADRGSVYMLTMSSAVRPWEFTMDTSAPHCRAQAVNNASQPQH